MTNSQEMAQVEPLWTSLRATKGQQYSSTVQFIQDRKSPHTQKPKPTIKPKPLRFMLKRRTPHFHLFKIQKIRLLISDVLKIKES